MEDAAAAARKRRLHVHDDGVAVHRITGVVNAHRVLVYQRRLDQTVAHHQLIREVARHQTFRLHGCILEFAADAIPLEVLDGDVVDQSAFLPCHGDAVVGLEVRVDFAVAPDEHVLTRVSNGRHFAADLDKAVHFGGRRALQLSIVEFHITEVDHQLAGKRIHALREIQRFTGVRGHQIVECGQVVGGAVPLETIIQHVQHPAAAPASTQGCAIQVIYHVTSPP